MHEVAIEWYMNDVIILTALVQGEIDLHNQLRDETHSVDTARLTGIALPNMCNTFENPL